ncbi:MAG: tetraacyldisaccharide 4'-kinase [Pseudomonadota bacterium]
MLQRLWYWQHPLVARCLSPLSVPLRPLIAARRRWWQRGERRYRPPVPLVVVGNISVGGTGKTPFLIWLAETLRDEGWRVGVISRGYGARPGTWPRRVSADSQAWQVGDEPLMIYQALNRDDLTPVSVVVGPNRAEDIRQLLAETPVDVLLSDDGLQHYAVDRDVEIAVVDAARGLGNGQLLPFGPLREPPGRLAEVDWVVANGGHFGDAVTMQLRPGQLRPLAGGADEALASWRGRAVHAVAGIGHPQRFFDSLRAAGLQVREHAFPDHHQYRPGELQFDDDWPVIMTEKDAVKCRQLSPDRLWYLPVSAELPEGFKSRLLSHIKDLIQG